jgi:type II secretory pathway pseudopilin PulG
MKKMTKNNQRGMTFIGLVLVIAAVLFLAVIGMKVVPAYLEFVNVKNAIKKAANSADTSDKKAVMDAFSKSAAVDNITVIKPADLVVNGGVISVEYQVVVPIVANASVLLDFSASSAK